MRFGGKVAAALLVAAVQILSVAVTPATAVERALTTTTGHPAGLAPQSLSGFDPGNLIDDTVFFSKDTMSADQIQAFLNGKVPACQGGYTCLRSFGMATTSRPADAVCRSPYTGRGWESAAQIIYNVAQACGINPQVLLVTLQKEQGLVTHTWPSDWRYTIAMGQGCPDTAACDTRYYGFFNQVYGAAWQFKRYANPPGTSRYFTWYEPGRTWNVRFNPDVACGSSPVRIANQATANLYYYTPYQPNAAALAAGFGTGDACSSYGNRNFYNYFTDWFGSTRAPDITLAKSESSSTVWVVSSTNRWALSSVAEWRELDRAFGPTFTVSDAFLQSRVDRGLGSNVVRDTSTGTMAVIDEGRSWGLTSCADVAVWGGTCSNPVDLERRVYQRATPGAVVGRFLRVYDSNRWGILEAGAVRVLYDATSATRVNAGAVPSAPRMSPRAYQPLQKTAVQFAPGELVYTATDSTVLLADGRANLVPLSSWTTVREMGIAPASARAVDGAALNGYARKTTPLAPLVTCGTATYLPASGTLHPLGDPARTGLSSTALDPETCGSLRLSSNSIPAALVKATGDATVYSIEGGQKRALTSWAAAVELGGASPVILTVHPTWIAAIPSSAAVIADGTLVKGSSPSVYLKSANALLGVTSFAITRELGLGASFRQVTDAELAKLESRGGVVGLWVTCAGVVSFGASGVLHPVRSPDAGATVMSLSDAACQRLDRSGAAVDRVFVKDSGATVYLANGGGFRPIGGWSTLLREAGGTVPPILTVSDATLSILPIGPTLN